MYQPEDRDALERLLRPKSYHAVVANPPYITPKDRALNQAYRDRYSTCHMQYSLAVPFLERIVSLAVEGGFTGQITANSFMKREFGKKLIEEFFPRVDLTHVIDTSGAYIPGHGTPTVILFARNQKPVASTLRTVMGIRGEPSRPMILQGACLVGDRRADRPTRLAERIRERRRFAARTVPQASLVDRRGRGSGVEGADWTNQPTLDSVTSQRIQLDIVCTLEDDEFFMQPVSDVPSMPEC